VSVYVCVGFIPSVGRKGQKGGKRKWEGKQKVCSFPCGVSYDDALWIILSRRFPATFQHNISLSLSLSLTHTHTHTHTHTLSLAHTHSLSLSHTHTLCTHLKHIQHLASLCPHNSSSSCISAKQSLPGPSLLPSQRKPEETKAAVEALLLADLTKYDTTHSLVLTELLVPIYKGLAEESKQAQLAHLSSSNPAPPCQNSTSALARLSTSHNLTQHSTPAYETYTYRAW